MAMAAENEHVSRRYGETKDRLASFSRWPHRLLHPPQKVAEAGFWFTGKDDETVCCVCGLQARNWLPNDNEWRDHAKLSPECPLVHHMKNIIEKEILLMDNFILGEEYASGHFSEICLARNKQGDIYTVKRLVTPAKRPEESILEKLTALPPHNNIITMQDIFFHGSLPRMYLVMEVCPPITLNHVVIKEEDMAVKTKMNFMTDIARGMNFLHQHRIVHGDLRPTNIFVVFAVTDFVCKISDYGIAKIQEATSSREQRIADHFKAPEVQETNQFSQSGDVFTMAQVFYVILAEFKTKENGKELLVPALELDDSAYTLTLLARKGVLSDIMRKCLSELKPMSDLMIAMLQLQPTNRPNSEYVFTKLCEAKGTLARRADDSGADASDLLGAMLLLHLFDRIAEAEASQEVEPEPEPEPVRRTTGLGTRIKNVFRRNKQK